MKLVSREKHFEDSFIIFVSFFLHRGRCGCEYVDRLVCLGGIIEMNGLPRG